MVQSGKKTFIPLTAFYLGDMNIAGAVASFALDVGEARRTFHIDKPGLHAVPGCMAGQAARVLVMTAFDKIFHCMVVCIVFATDKKLTVAETTFRVVKIAVLAGGHCLVIGFFTHGPL